MRASARQGAMACAARRARICILKVDTMRSYVVILACLLALGACGPRNVFDGEFRHVAKPQPVAVVCERLECDVPGAVDGFAADSSYVFYTMLHPGHRMEICDLNTLSVDTKIVNVGRGPNEYNYITYYKRVFDRNGDVCFWIFSASAGDAALMNLTKSRKESRTVIDTVIKPAKALADAGLRGQLYSFDVLNDSLAAYQASGHDGLRQGICDLAGRIVWSADCYVTAAGEPSVTGGNFIVRPDMRKAVFTPAFFDQIDICDVGGDGRFSVSTRRRPIDMAEVLGTDMTARKMYTIDTHVTDDRIISYCRDGEDGVAELRIFDWDGRLLHVLRPDVEMHSISVTGGGMLYGFVSDTELCRVDISGYLTR